MVRPIIARLLSLDAGHPIESLAVIPDGLSMNSTFETIAIYLRMIKFSHSIFALPLALVALVLALPDSGFLSNGFPLPAFWILMAQVVICMISLRSAAMGFNRLVDHKIDAVNPRTSSREIPAGKISPIRAALFTILFLAIFQICAITINALCGWLAPIAIFAVLGYSYTKRFTFMCHYFLGLAIAIAPTGAWVALRESIDVLPLLWSGGMLFYIAGFDILYSCQDVAFDQQKRLHSLPSRFSVPTALWVARISHTIALAFFIMAGYIDTAGYIYGITMFIVALLFIKEHQLVQPQTLDQIPQAFFNINAIISTVLFIGVIIDLYLRGKLFFS